MSVASVARDFPEGPVTQWQWEMSMASEAQDFAGPVLIAVLNDPQSSWEYVENMCYMNIQLSPLSLNPFFLILFQFLSSMIVYLNWKLLNLLKFFIYKFYFNENLIQLPEEPWEHHLGEIWQGMLKSKFNMDLISFFYQLNP